MTEFICWSALIFGGYLFGSVMFARDVPRLFGYGDIAAKSDDGNPGAANVFKQCGVSMGLLCLFLDMLKGFAPVYIAYRLFGISSVRFSLVMFAPVFGHACSVLNHFRGGKCIATVFGVLIGCLPATHVGFILAGLYIFFSVVVKINPHRIRSILTFAMFLVVSLPLLLYAKKFSVALGVTLISGTAILKHMKWFEKCHEAEKIQGEADGEEEEVREKRA